RHARVWQVLLGSSLLFGLWHVLPASAAAAGNAALAGVVHGLGGLTQFALIAGTVLFTAAGGLVAGELRRRSGSVLASIGMHWATNGLGVLFGSLAWRLAVCAGQDGPRWGWPPGYGRIERPQIAVGNQEASCPTA